MVQLGDVRKIKKFGKGYELVSDSQEIEKVLTSCGYKPQGLDDAIYMFDIPSACLFVLAQDGEMIQVWGSYQVAPELNTGAELIWHDNMSDGELAELEGCNPLFSVEYFIGMAGYLPNDSGLLSADSWTELREQIADLFTEYFEDFDFDDEDEAQWLHFIEQSQEKIALATSPEEIPYLGDFDVVGITFSDWVVGDSPTPPSPTTPSPADDESKSPSKLIFIEEEKFDAPIDSDENDWHIASVKSYVFGEKRED